MNKELYLGKGYYLIFTGFEDSILKRMMLGLPLIKDETKTKK